MNWPHQDYALSEVPRRIEAGQRKLCITSPTGGGKSRIICGLIQWAVAKGWGAVLYTNRRLLIAQLAKVLGQYEICFGTRAAGHEEQRHLPVQVSSLPTERSRVLRRGLWDLHGNGGPTLVLVDEAHLNASGTAMQVLGKHHARGDAYVGFTATPIDLGHLYDELVVCGTHSELRKCGALVAAYHYAPDEPDMKRFKQNLKTGEYSENDIRKAMQTKYLWGRVLDWYQRLNPERRPTLLFGPGVAESIWFAEQFTKEGIRAAHIDGDGIWLDGEYRRCDIDERQGILEGVRHGDIQVLCNRFVAREGLDLPEVSHIILATVFGSLQSYLQSVGRGLRACAGKDRLTIQDHGGAWHRHGSVNVDRDWNPGLSGYVAAELRRDWMRAKKIPEPICCPRCAKVRASGHTCPECGYSSTKRSRYVIQANGKLVEHVGDIYRPRRVAYKVNTVQIWTKCYYRARKSKNRMTFRQAEGLFFYENHYWPPRDLPLMPQHELDWFLPVCEVPGERLSPYRSAAYGT